MTIYRGLFVGSKLAGSNFRKDYMGKLSIRGTNKHSFLGNCNGVKWDWTSTRGCKTLDYAIHTCFIWMHVNISVNAWYIDGDWDFYERSPSPFSCYDMSHVLMVFCGISKDVWIWFITCMMCYFLEKRTFTLIRSWRLVRVFHAWCVGRGTQLKNDYV